MDSTLYSTRSFNNRLVVQPYVKQGLQATIKNGFALVEQKVTVRGLRVLLETKLNDGTIIEKGSVAYVKEELLHTSQWAQKILECEAIKEPFIIVDISNVEFVIPPGAV